MQDLEQRMARIEGTYEQVCERLGSIDSRLSHFEVRADGRFTGMDARFDGIARKIEALDGKIGNHFMWTLGIILGTWITTLGTWLATVLAVARH